MLPKSSKMRHTTKAQIDVNYLSKCQLTLIISFTAILCQSLIGRVMYHLIDPHLWKWYLSFPITTLL